MLTGVIAVIILQYIQVSNHIIHLKKGKIHLRKGKVKGLAVFLIEKNLHKIKQMKTGMKRED